MNDESTIVLTALITFVVCVIGFLFIDSLERNAEYRKERFVTVTVQGLEIPENMECRAEIIGPKVHKLRCFEH